MIKKSMVCSIVLILIILNCGCGTYSQSNGDDGVEHKVSVVKILEDMPYASYINPVLVDDEMYICVGGSLSSIGMVVDYNIKSKKSKLIFESQFSEASVSNTMANDKWVIWVDSDSSGTHNIIYAFNRISEKTFKIAEYKAATNDYVITAPYLSGDYIAWIETESGSSAKVKLYNLQTSDCIDIAKLNDHSFYNNFVFLDDDQLLWTDNINGKGYYLIYNIKAESTKKIDAPYPYPGYAQRTGELLFSINFDDYHNWTDQNFGCFDTSTLKYSSIDVEGTSYINQFRIKRNILAVMSSDNKLKLIDVEKGKLVDCAFPLMTIDTIDISSDGRIVVGARATDKNNLKLVIIDCDD